jgi:hypothetical protein
VMQLGVLQTVASAESDPGVDLDLPWLPR